MITLRVGDCREWLRLLPPNSVHCAVTSPPYFGLRDYGVAGQIGLEPTPAAYVAEMVTVFREVRRVLRENGTMWINLGSSYASGDMSASQSRPLERVPACDSDGRAPTNYPASGFSCSDLCDECLTDFLSRHGHMLGIGLRHSRGPLPFLPTSHGNGHLDSGLTSQDVSARDALVSTTLESWRQLRGVCSRCDSRVSGLSAVRSSSGDALASVRSSWLNYTMKPKDLIPIPWLVALALQADGWWLRQDLIWSKPNPMPESVRDRCTKAHEYIFLLNKSERYYYDAEAIAEDAISAGQDRGGGHRYNPDAANDQHMRAGLAKIGVTGQTRNKRSVWEVATQPYSDAHFATFPPALIEPCILAGCPKSGTVLDPFAGAGTTGMVADRLGRDAILIELNPAYAEMIERRIVNDAGLFADVRIGS